jgi:hypothetical protein
MSRRNGSLTLFDRLRRAAPLRVLLTVATLLTFQDSLACACENLASEPEAASSDLAASPTDDPSEGCGTFCSDCASCGSCCNFAASSRTSASQLGLFNTSSKIGLATAAPEHWVPPTLLRPPIDAV